MLIGSVGGIKERWEPVLERVLGYGRDEISAIRPITKLYILILPQIGSGSIRKRRSEPQMAPIFG
jgi:hypothetical protein